MKIKDVLAKAAKGEELTEDEKAFIESYEEPDVEAVANARGKKERLKLEKKLTDLQERLDEKDAEIEAANEGSSELEKLQRQMEKLNAKYEKAEEALNAEKTAHAGTLRSNALKGLSVNWMSDVPGEYVDNVMSTAFKDIDTEDLADSAVTKPIIDTLVESQARFINSGVQGGAGSGQGESGDPVTSKKWTREKVNTAIADGSYSEHRDEIMSAMGRGELNET